MTICVMGNCRTMRDGWKRVTLEPAAVLVVLGVAGAALYAAVGEEDPGP